MRLQELPDSISCKRSLCCKRHRRGRITSENSPAGDSLRVAAGWLRHKGVNMGVKLSELVKQVENTGIHLLGGKNGLDRVVDWVHIVGNLETAGFLKGGEIVFTTGIGMEEETSLLRLTQKIYSHHASGLIVNIGPYIKEVPRDVIDFADEKDFPVFTVPWKVYLADMMRVFCYEIQQKEQKEMELSAAFKYCLYTPDEESLYMSTLMKKGYARHAQYTLVVTHPVEKTQVSQEKIIYSELTAMRRRQLLKIWAGYIQTIRANAVILEDEPMIVTILPDMEEEQAIPRLKDAKRWLEHYLQETEILFTAAGEHVDHIKKLKESYKQAKKIELYMRNIRQDESVVGYSQMGLVGLLLESNRKALEYYCAKTIYPIQKYDAINESNLCEVLQSYMKHNGSINQVAEELFVHRNTVNYKIKKIEQILGKNLSDFAVRNEIMTGLAAAQVCQILRS